MAPEETATTPAHVEDLRIVTVKERDSLLRSTARANTFEGLMGAYLAVAARFPVLLNQSLELPESKRNWRQLYNFKNCLRDVFIRQIVQFSALGLQASSVDQAVKDISLFDEVAGRGAGSNSLSPADLAIRLCKDLPKSQKLNLLYYLHKTIFLVLEATFFEEAVVDDVYSRAIARVNFLNTMFAFPVFGWDMLDDEDLRELTLEFEADRSHIISALSVDTLWARLQPLFVGGKVQPESITYYPCEAQAICLETQRALAFLRMVRLQDSTLFEDYEEPTTHLRAMFEGERTGVPVLEPFSTVPNYSLLHLNRLLTGPKAAISDREVACFGTDPVTVIQAPTSINYYVTDIGGEDLDSIVSFHENPARWIVSRNARFQRGSVSAQFLEESHLNAQKLRSDLTLEGALRSSFSALDQHVLRRIVARGNIVTGVQLLICYGAVLHGDRLLVASGVLDPRVQELATVLVTTFSRALAEKAVELSQALIEMRKSGTKGEGQDDSLSSASTHETLSLPDDAEIRWSMQVSGFVAEQWAQNLQDLVTSVSSSPDSVEALEELAKRSESDDKPVLLNLRSGCFHLIKCPSSRKLDPENTKLLKSASEARAEGFRPCRRCIAIRVS